jgi:hypothetical protein
MGFALWRRWRRRVACAACRCGGLVVAFSALRGGGVLVGYCMEMISRSQGWVCLLSGEKCRSCDCTVLVLVPAKAMVCPRLSQRGCAWDDIYRDNKLVSVRLSDCCYPISISEVAPLEWH